MMTIPIHQRRYCAITPAEGAQRNFTVAASRIMFTRTGWMPAYNSQLAVNVDYQVIVAQTLTPCAADTQHLAPMPAAIEADARRVPETLPAEGGCCSEANP